MQAIQSEATRRTAAGIESAQPRLFLIPDDREEIAADTGTGRLHQSQCGVSADRSVHCGAALSQKLYGDLGGKRLTRRRNAMGGHHDGTRCEWLLEGPIHRSNLRLTT